jgi:hypothetical protein
MENFSELMRQARVYMSQNPDFIPLHYVEEVAMYGNVDVYVVAQGVNINTPEGCAILNFEAALYLVCRQLCDLGVGDRPFHPLPYLHDPIIVAEEEMDAGDPDAAMEQPFDGQQGEDAPIQAGAVEPPANAGDGVQVQGPFIWQDPVPPPPPLVPAPVVPYLEQPLHWVFSELPPEPKPEPNQGPGEYIEPAE